MGPSALGIHYYSTLPLSGIFPPLGKWILAPANSRRGRLPTRGETGVGELGSLWKRRTQKE